MCPLNLISDNTTWACLRCSSPCSTCQGSITNCTTCISTYFLFVSDGACLSSCPNGYYSSAGVCNLCFNSCATCSNYSFCLSCSPPLLLSNSQCITSCPSATPFNHSSICMTCSQAQNSCLICNSSLSTAECIVCLSGMVVF